MAPVFVLLPPALLLVGAGVSLALAGAGRRWAAPAGLVAAWLAVGAGVATWLLARSTPVELVFGWQPAGVPAGVRLDALSFAFLLAVLVPHALVAGFQARAPGDAVAAGLVTAAAALAVLSDRLLFASVGMAGAAGLALAHLTWEARGSGSRVPVRTWLPLVAAGLCAVWGGVAVLVAGGTTAYVAAPITALRVPALLLLAAAAGLGAGLVPGAAWTATARTRPGAASATAAVAVMPLGFLLLLRAYSLGAGSWPATWLNPVLAAAGAAVALVAALRAQAATDREGLQVETLALDGGLVLLALSLSTPAGLAAAICAVSASAAARPGAVLPVPRPAAAGAAGLAVLAALPPLAGFGARLLVLQAAFEAGGPWAWLVLPGAAAWLLGIGASARGLRLSAAAPTAGPAAAWTVAGLAAALGLGLGAFFAGVALPAAAELMAPPAGGGSAGVLLPALPGVGYDPLLVGLPLLALFGALSLARRGLVPVPRPAPVLPLVSRPAWLRLPPAAAAGGAELLGGLAGGAAVTKALTSSRPWLWAGLTVALLVAVAPVGLIFALAGLALCGASALFVAAADGRAGLALGLALAGAGLAAFQLADRAPAAAAVTLSAGLAAGALRLRDGPPGVRLLTPGSTPRLALVVVAAVVALFLGVSILGGPASGRLVAVILLGGVAVGRLMSDVPEAAAVTAAAALVLALGALGGALAVVAGAGAAVVLSALPPGEVREQP